MCSEALLESGTARTPTARQHSFFEKIDIHTYSTCTAAESIQMNIVRGSLECEALGSQLFQDSIHFVSYIKCLPDIIICRSTPIDNSQTNTAILQDRLCPYPLLHIINSLWRVIEQTYIINVQKSNSLRVKIQTWLLCGCQRRGRGRCCNDYWRRSWNGMGLYSNSIGSKKEYRQSQQ